MSFNILEYVPYTLECKIYPDYKNESGYSDKHFFIDFIKEDDTYIPVISGENDEGESVEHSDYTLDEVTKKLFWRDWLIVNKTKK